MRRRAWGIAGLVVVLAAAGAPTALLLSGGDSGDYKALPTCGKLGEALPGKPALTVGENVTDAQFIRGLDPAYSNIECKSDAAKVFVQVYGTSNMDLITAARYKDGAVHDGTWRANDYYAKQTQPPQTFFPLKPGVSYGSVSTTNDQCMVVAVKRNATIQLTVTSDELAKTHSVDDWKAACAAVATAQMPKVESAALG